MGREIPSPERQTEEGCPKLCSTKLVRMNLPSRTHEFKATCDLHDLLYYAPVPSHRNQQILQHGLVADFACDETEMLCNHHYDGFFFFLFLGTRLIYKFCFRLLSSKTRIEFSHLNENPQVSRIRLFGFP